MAWGGSYTTTYHLNVRLHVQVVTHRSTPMNIVLVRQIQVMQEAAPPPLFYNFLDLDHVMLI